MFLSVEELKDLYPWVIFFKPNLLKSFSKGRNSPKGTSLFLLYLSSISNSLLNTANELNIFSPSSNVIPKIIFELSVNWLEILSKSFSSWFISPIFVMPSG